MDFAEGGDLLSKVNTHKKNRTSFPEEEIWDILKNVVKGLRDMHKHKMMHRDIKGANIFVYKDNKVKIGDLNVSKLQKNGLAKTQTGTPY